MENTEKGMAPRTYLKKVLEEHQLFQDINFWDAAVFESIKNELSSDFYSEANKLISAKELLYSKLLQLQTYMLGFRIPKDQVKELIVKYCQSYSLNEEQIIQLIHKIANYGSEEVVLEQENVRPPGQEKLSPAKTDIPKWLRDIEDVGKTSSAYTQKHEKNLNKLFSTLQKRKRPTQHPLHSEIKQNLGP